MYIPYRKAYLTGMNPLSFITFFTVGELITMLILAISYREQPRSGMNSAPLALFSSG